MAPLKLRVSCARCRQLLICVYIAINVIFVKLDSSLAYANCYATLEKIPAAAVKFMFIVNDVV